MGSNYKSLGFTPNRKWIFVCKCHSATRGIAHIREQLMLLRNISHGCNKCGHSFCKPCLPYSSVVPRKGSKPQPVCKPCYTALTASPEERKQNLQNEGKYSPPENQKKFVAAYEAKQQAQGGRSKPSTSSASGVGSTTQNKYKGLSEADRKLAERLDRLKEDRRKMRGRVASVEEMEDRLRNLKGLPPSGSSAASSSQNQAASNLPPADTRTSFQQSDDLMTEMREEASLDARIAGQEDMEGESKDIEMPSEPELKSLEDEAKSLIQDAKSSLRREEEGAKKDDELSARVAKLKGINPASDSDKVADADNEVSDEEATKRLIAQLLEEDRMEAKIRADGFGDVLAQQKHVTGDSGATNKPPVDPDELPWCCICNEDATLRCHGCDDDLYCARCFREGHNQFDLPDHKTVPYKKPRNEGR